MFYLRHSPPLNLMNMGLNGVNFFFQKHFLGDRRLFWYSFFGFGLPLINSLTTFMVTCLIHIKLFYYIYYRTVPVIQKLSLDKFYPHTLDLFNCISQLFHNFKPAPAVLDQ